MVNTYSITGSNTEQAFIKLTLFLKCIYKVTIIGGN